MKNPRLISTVLLLASVHWVTADVTITGQPKNATVSLGATAQVTVTATSPVPPVSYHWWSRDAALDVAANPSAATARLTLTNVIPANAGPHFVVASDLSGSVTSQVATLTVDPTFTKITTGPLVTDLGCSLGAAWGDFDGDGYPDVFVPRYKTGLSTFYHNNRDGTFSAAATLPSQATADVWFGGVTADFDNDGKLDLFVGRENKPGFFYFNNGTGTFIASQFQSANPWSVSAVDYDRDGLLDLYISNFGGLFRNNGDRTFIRMQSKDVGGVVSGLFGGAAWADYDDDGWVDVFCANNNGPSQMFHNDGTGRFVAVQNPATESSALVGAWGDYDNDGRLDLCVVAFGGTSEVYHNLRNGQFELAAISQTIWGYYNSAAWADYDNDGFLDLFLTTGNGVPNALYHNNGDGTFALIQTGSVVTDLPTGGTDFWSYNGLWFDWDNDGFLDLYVANGNDAGTAETANFLYHNNGNSNSWLKVKLIGTVSNRDGVGAKVRVQARYAGQVRWQRRDISGGDVFNGNNLYAHFGLGDATNVMTLRIEWPSGSVQELTNVAPKQFLTIWEPPALKAAVQTDGTCLLTVAAEPNRAWRIESSTDLSTWQKLATVNNSSPVFRDNDTKSAGLLYRFYRLGGE